MASSTNPRIRVRDATPADLDVLVDIHFDAFGTNVMGELLSPGGVTEDQKKKFGETILAPTTPVPGEGETIVKVAELLPENDNGGAAEVVAFGKWALFRHPRSEEEWNVEIPYQTLETLGEGANPEVYNDFIRALHVKRRDLAKGDPVLILKIVCTTPKRQRLGAGWALLTWGTTLADELGIVTHLEASPPGYPLYRKAGYLPVDKFDLEVVKAYGGVRGEGESFGENSFEELGPLAEGTFRTAIMQRPLQTKTKGE